MKVILTTLISLLIFLCCWSVFGDRQVAAQTPGGKPEIFDPVQFDVISGDILPADEKARLDNLAFYLRQDPDRAAYIFVYASKRSCVGATQAKMAFVKNHLVRTRGIESARVILQDGGYREESTVEMWLWPRNGEFAPPPAMPHFEPGEVKMRSNCRPISRRHRGRRKRREQ